MSNKMKQKLLLTTKTVCAKILDKSRNATKELIAVPNSAQRAVGRCKTVRTDNEPRSGAESRNKVSDYGLPRYHGRRFDGISQSGLITTN